VYEIELGVYHLSTAKTYNNLGNLYNDRRKYDEAEKYYLKALNTKEKELGIYHPSTADIYHNLKVMYRGKGEHDKAAIYSKKLLEVSKKEDI